MPSKTTAQAPTVSDVAVKAKTGKNWAGWFGVLDKAGAKKLDHKTIATMLAKQHGLSGWWSQMVTVEYELSRGLRVRHEKNGGFSVSASKTVAASLSDLYAATVDPTRRRKWFPKGKFEASSQTEDKYLRGAWNSAARLEIGFYAKGPDKSQIAVSVNKLASKDEVEPQRAAWKAALEKLQAMLTD